MKRPHWSLWCYFVLFWNTLLFFGQGLLSYFCVSWCCMYRFLHQNFLQSHLALFYLTISSLVVHYFMLICINLHCILVLPFLHFQCLKLSYLIIVSLLSSRVTNLGDRYLVWRTELVIYSVSLLQWTLVSSFILDQSINRDAAGISSAGEEISGTTFVMSGDAVNDFSLIETALLCYNL